MTSDQLSQAISNAFVQGGEQFLEGTMAAALPLLWMLVIALLLARPYMVRTTQKFSLRLGADIWWVLYIGLRDLVIALTAILSFMFLYPDVLLGNSFPIGGSRAQSPHAARSVLFPERFSIRFSSDAFRTVTWADTCAGQWRHSPFPR